ncbi:MAG: RNA-binding protein [Clostridia bacterium]|nr:RNA-binding protein [Clostridia bacterium]
MRLEYGPFDKIDREKKTIELRLFDEKRRRIRVGDVIRFECTLDEDALYVRVKALHVFPSFEDLFQKLPLTACGYADASGGEPAEDMRRYYSAEDERKYGVVGIEIEQLLD